MAYTQEEYLEVFGHFEKGRSEVYENKFVDKITAEYSDKEWWAPQESKIIQELNAIQKKANHTAISYSCKTMFFVFGKKYSFS